MTDPDGNPATADQPGIVSNSWSASTANDTWFRPMIRRWLDLGMLPVFAAGNAGPAAGSVGSPAGYPEALAVGAIDSADAVPSFSGRGPVVWQNADGLGPAAGTVLAKPDLAAPGVGITSSTGSGYLSYSGTSMAAPARRRRGRPAAPGQPRPERPGPRGHPPAVGRSTSARRAWTRPRASDGSTRCAPWRPPSARRPTPASSPPHRPSPTRAALVYAVSVSGGATAVRTRVDGGAWSAPVAPGNLSLEVAEGRHVVEAQAIDASGAVDPTPARHAVAVDRTGPRITIRMRRSGTTMTFRSTVSDGLSGAVRTACDGASAAASSGAAATVKRRFAEGGRRRVVLTARDAAGNQSYAKRAFAPRAASALRGLRAPRAASRRTRNATVAGSPGAPGDGAPRGCDGSPARASRRPRASPRPSPPPGSASRSAARRSPRDGAAPFARASGSRGLRPGVYRLEVSAAERGTKLGKLRTSRRIVIR